jgi:hypothetical protein
MHWFRSKRVGVTWLALFALACQFVLAFGHVHPDKANIGSDAWAISADADNHTTFLSSPSNKPANGLLGDVCAICASISLASTVFVPTTPTVTPPVSGMRTRLWFLAEAAPISFEHLFFDARGPPRA